MIGVDAHKLGSQRDVICSGMSDRDQGISLLRVGKVSFEVNVSACESIRKASPERRMLSVLKTSRV